MTFHSAGGSPPPGKHIFRTFLRDHSDISVGTCRKRTLQQRLHAQEEPSFYIYLRTTPFPPSSPDAVICCSYFINVLLTIIGLKAAEWHIINCNKWKPSGYIYCSTVALLQLWNWFSKKKKGGKKEKSLRLVTEDACDSRIELQRKPHR